MASAQLPGNPIDSKVGLEGDSSLPAGEELPFTQRYGIKPAKKIINENAGSILADEDPPVVLSSAEEHRLRTAFTNNAPAAGKHPVKPADDTGALCEVEGELTSILMIADPTGGKTLNREGIRAVLKELGIPGISDDMLIARCATCHHIRLVLPRSKSYDLHFFLLQVLLASVGSARRGREDAI